MDNSKRYGNDVVSKADGWVKLVFIIGNTAVGKMTVGQELMKITGLRLFHNHMSIEPIIEMICQRKVEKRNVAGYRSARGKVKSA